MNRLVRQPYRSMTLTPETTSSAHFRVSVRCGNCCVSRTITVTEGRFAKMWTVDWVTIFEKVRFRCRCGALADALKVERHTHDRPEEVLFMQVQTTLDAR